MLQINKLVLSIWIQVSCYLDSVNLIAYRYAEKKSPVSGPMKLNTSPQALENSQQYHPGGHNPEALQEVFPFRFHYQLFSI